jgi:antitoxin (DNA-binding transcriptional repressor) of toxin-antitoxin stability system
MQTVTATQLARQTREILDAVAAGETYAIERSGKTIACLQPPGAAQTVVETARARRHSDLDALAGTWSEEEYRAFESASAEFSKIDEELWK